MTYIEDFGKAHEWLEKLAELAIDGAKGLISVEDFAKNYYDPVNQKEFENDEAEILAKLEASDKLIRWQILKTSTTGFITNIGGLLTLPVAIPADLASSMVVNLRMIAAIAYIGGYDIHDDRVKTLMYMCLAGDSSVTAAKNLGINIAEGMAAKTLDKIPKSLLVSINKKIGKAIFFKTTQKAGKISLSKAIPFVGGIIGGAVDGITTNILGNRAKNIFIIESTSV